MDAQRLAGKPGLATNVTTSTPLSSAGVALNDFHVNSVETQFQNQVERHGQIRHRRDPA